MIQNNQMKSYLSRMNNQMKSYLSRMNNQVKSYLSRMNNQMKSLKKIHFVMRSFENFRFVNCLIVNCLKTNLKSCRNCSNTFQMMNLNQNLKNNQEKNHLSLKSSLKMSH